MKEINIALIGTPNSGKTTVFNRLTKSKSKIGNYPGVTVERKEGYFEKDGYKCNIIDLPGVYSLSSHFQEERIARDYILEKKPDIIINVLDASNIERNLFLTTQLMEFGIPIILVCNKMDIANAHNIVIDINKLSYTFEVNIVETIASNNIGIKKLKEEIFKIKDDSKGIYIKFSEDIEEKIDDIQKKYDCLRWCAVKILESDKYIEEKLKIKNEYEDKYEEIISYERHFFLKKILKSIIKPFEKHITKSDIIDKILINKFLGLPIFLFMMFLVFQFTFILGSYPTMWLKILFNKFSFFISTMWSYDSFFRSILVEGIIGGVGSVLIYLPNILFLFFALAILEESGYMARAAFVMDRMMHKIGLHGKSFIPMLIGFGCTVPAIMSTRMLENKRDRLTTILVLPFLSCSAKLAVFTLIIPAFFTPIMSGIVLFSLYLLGIFLAILFAKVLRAFFFKGDNIPFIMEMPFYQFPNMKNVFYDVFYKGWLYIKKAGTIILFFSIVLFFLSYFPKDEKVEKKYDDSFTSLQKEFAEKIKDVSKNSKTVEEFYHKSNKQKFIDFYETKLKNNFSKDDELISLGKEFNEKVNLLKEEKRQKSLIHSYIGKMGRWVEPFFKPLGFDWKINTALFGSISAKEVFISQLSIIFSTSQEKGVSILQKKLKENYNVAIAISILVFILVSAPCFTTFLMTKKETDSILYAITQICFLTVFAYFMSFFVYRLGIFFN